MIIEELKKFLRATILMSTDMTKKEFALELLEIMVQFETKERIYKLQEPEPPPTDLPSGSAPGSFVFVDRNGRPSNAP